MSSSPTDDRFSAVREHYTQVCKCEWTEDDFTRTTTAENCSLHGKVPDPLAALGVEYAALLEVAQVLEAARPFLGLEVVNSVGAQAGRALRALEEARRG